MATTTGVIKSIVQDRGFGFIEPDGGEQRSDVFFHFRALDGLSFDPTLVQRRVSFTLGIDPKSGKVRATSVWAAD